MAATNPSWRARRCSNMGDPIFILFFFFLSFIFLISSAASGVDALCRTVTLLRIALVLLTTTTTYYTHTMHVVCKFKSTGGPITWGV